MGARPIALLDGLRFGEPGWMFERAVEGIGHYGNCVGVPTVGGEAVFDEAYTGNCLVNAMCVGLLPVERVLRAGATEPGRAIVLYGATTGRDGIGGASVLASQELGEEDADKRPTVQIGDPFTGKKLIEASQELVELGLVDSLQDCGAAGLASALAEMARDGAGVDVELDRVPLREEDLEPWEIMISESQERMVCVTSRVDEVAAICRKWDLNHAVIGEVTGSGDLRAFHDGELVGDIPARLLTDECPRYEVPTRPKETTRGGRAVRAQRAEPRLGLRALRPARRVADDPAARVGRGGAPAPALLPRAGRLARRPAGRRARPVPRRRARRAGRGAQRRLLRRRADRAHRLPQLRQARRSPRSPGSSSRRSRGSRRRRRRSGSRSCRETSRSTTTPTAARSRRRRSSAASASSRTSGRCRAAGAEGTRSASSGAPVGRPGGRRPS